MVYLWATLLVIVNAGWALTVVLGLPGTWLIVATTAAVAWLNRAELQAGTPGMIGAATLAALLVLATLGELIEFLAGAAGAKRGGGSRRGAWGAIFGGIAGAIVFLPLIPVPLVGSLIGACLGAGVGAAAFELVGGGRPDASVRIAWHAGLGTFYGRGAKVAIGLLMWVIASIAAFWP